MLENGRSLNELLPLVFEKYPPKERAWLQEVTFGALRNLPKLQIWLRALLNKPLKNKQKIIEHLLIIGMYQLAFTRTAQHAAVTETVEACKKMNQVRLAGLVNAILRSFQRERLHEQPIEELHAKAGLPKWLYKQLTNSYASKMDIEHLAAKMQERAPLFLRINTQVIKPEAFLQMLSEHNYDFEFMAPITVKLNISGDIPSIIGFHDGYFSVQDYAAQQAALLLNVQEGDVVLDCCAAPGGKTSAILENQPRLSALYAIDSDPKRMKKVQDNLLRLKHLDHFGDKLTLLTKDATTLSKDPLLPMFDKILLDAPCSATGVIRRHPDILWLRKPSDIDELVKLQREILKQAWCKLKVNGELLYATCSILPQENKTQIDGFIADNNDAKLVTMKALDNTEKKCWQIMTGELGMDGFFYAKLKKVKRTSDSDEKLV